MVRRWLRLYLERERGSSLMSKHLYITVEWVREWVVILYKYLFKSRSRKKTPSVENG